MDMGAKMFLYALLKEMQMFEQFSRDEIGMIADMKHSVLGFKSGETLIAEGDESFSMFLLISGVCMITKVQDDISVRLAEIRSGELFGEMSFFTKMPRQTNVIAKDDVMVMRMDEDFFKKVDPEVRDKIKNHIIMLLISRLNTMDDSVARTSKFLHTQK